MSQIVDDLRQVAIEIKTETQVGGNTAARVGGAFERVADALEGTQQIEDMDAAVAAVQQAAQENEQTIQNIVNSLAVVQTTGQSATAVMSQKAVSDRIAYEIDTTFVNGGIATATGEDTTTQARLRSELVHLNKGDKIKIIHNEQNAGVYLWNASQVYQGIGVAFASSIEYYEMPYDGYVKFVVAKKDTTAHILPTERTATFYRYPVVGYETEDMMLDEYASNIDINSLCVGIGYPSATTQKWLVDQVGTNYRFHRVLEVGKAKRVKIVAPAEHVARYAFVKDYSVPTATTDCQFCTNHVAVYELITGISSGWVDIPSDCKYIILIEQNGATQYLADAVYLDHADDADAKNYSITINDLYLRAISAVYGSDTNNTIRRASTPFFYFKAGDEINIAYNQQCVNIFIYDVNYKFIRATTFYCERKFRCENDCYLRFVIAGKSKTENLTGSLTARISFNLRQREDYIVGDANWRSNGGIVCASWNIGHFSFGGNQDSTITASDYDVNLQQYREMVKMMDADLISLPEYSKYFYQQEEAKDLLFADMSYNHVGIQNQYACQAVYANHFISAQSDDNITSVTTTHYYTLLEFEHLGKNVKFVGIHFQANADQTDDSGIIAQFNEIVNTFANDDYVIIAGDFNLLLMSSLDVFTNAGYSLANGGRWGNLVTYTMQKGTELNKCFDNIAVKGFYIEDVKVISYDLSDHYPIVAKLMLKQNI